MKDSTRMTEEQIVRAQKLFGAELRRHRKEFPEEVVEAVLTQKRAVVQAEFLSIFRKFIKLWSNIIVWTVLVKYGRTPQEAINATDCYARFINDINVKIPGGGGKKRRVTVIFFRVGKCLDDDNLEKEYKNRGLIPADPYALAAVNEANPDFAYTHHNGTHWKDDNGNWCYIFFKRSWGELHVQARCYNKKIWERYWWFAGVSVEKKSQDSST